MKTIPVSVLIVDDLQENLIALDALLRQPGLEVLKVRTGQEALEMLLLHDVALAIVDVQMPGMSGFELAELMRGMERTRRVPIIFVTAGAADRQRRFRGYEAGAVDFLNKPIEPDVLRSKAEVFFELYRQRQEVAQQRDDLKEAADRIQVLLKKSREQAQALREADQRKDEFLATLAHELRNPLAPIRNAIEILRMRTPATDELREPIEIAARQSKHMSRLIDDLLDVARIANGKIELRIERCDLLGIVRETVEDYRPTFVERKIALSVSSDVAQLPIDADSTRIAQMVGNLLHNAHKFTPPGGRVEVSVKRDPGNSAAVVIVQDTGAGFDPSHGSRLFEPFGQAHPTSEMRAGGLGLGLALTKGFVELHGGTVRGESHGVGQGATFTLSFPLAAESEPTPEKDAGSAHDASSSLSIVVVEDNMDSAASLKLLLTMLGHRVEVAHNGGEGLSLTKSLRPDVVISDLGLPGKMDGYAVARGIRSETSLNLTRLIALSGFGMDEDKRRTQEAGFDDHLIKPVSLAALKTALSACQSAG